MKKKVFLVGLDEELIVLSQIYGVNLIGIIENSKKGIINNFKIYHESEELIKTLSIKNIIIGIDSPKVKQKLDNFYSAYNIKPYSLIANELHASSSYEPGLILQQEAYVSVNCKIGRYVKINVGATIMHDVKIGNYSTIAPKAVLLGRVKIGSCVFIGANATILPDIIIGDNVIIGAGAVVTKNIPSGVIAKGVPAKY